MEKIITFHDSEKGYLHLIKGLLVEDCSDSKEADSYYVVAVSDGHGDPACFRSHIGAKLAVEITIKVLEEFAEAFYDESIAHETDININRHEADITDERFVTNVSFRTVKESLLSEREKHTIIKRVTDTIVSQWSHKVIDHFRNNPLDKIESQKAGDTIDLRGEEQIYGCTILGALWIQDYLILIQQGDGRCFVHYNNNSFCEPVPWDELCQGNITTSLCDENAAQSIRHAVINIKEHSKEIIGVYLCSDGIEDSFIEDDLDENPHEGCYYYLKKVLSKLIETNFDKSVFLEWLKKDLKDTSKAGSADDMSIAAIVNQNAIEGLLQAFQRDIEKYQIRCQIHFLQNKLKSMQRKHDYLYKLVSEKSSKESRPLKAFKNESCVPKKKENEDIKYLEDLEKILLKIQESDFNKEDTIDNWFLILSLDKYIADYVFKQLSLLLLSKQREKKNLGKKIVEKYNERIKRRLRYNKTQKEFQEHDNILFKLEQQRNSYIDLLEKSKSCLFQMLEQMGYSSIMYFPFFWVSGFRDDVKKIDKLIVLSYKYQVAITKYNRLIEEEEKKLSTMKAKELAIEKEINIVSSDPSIILKKRKRLGSEIIELETLINGLQNPNDKMLWETAEYISNHNKVSEIMVNKIITFKEEFSRNYMQHDNRNSLSPKDSYAKVPLIDNTIGVKDNIGEGSFLEVQDEYERYDRLYRDLETRLLMLKRKLEGNSDDNKTDN